MSKNAMTISFVSRPGNEIALAWEKKITRWLNKKYPKIKILDDKSSQSGLRKIVIVLGGDGTILEAARKYQNHSSVILGLNLGQVGFLASIRDPKNFIFGLDKFFKGQYWIAKRMMVQANIVRNKKIIFTANALNEVVVQNILGMVDLEVRLDNDPIQRIRGTGVLISTATGSTAYNLSAHGPLLMPEMEGFIVTELLDHDIPSPSIVVKKDKTIQIKVLGFRERGLLSITKTGKRADVVFMADGTSLFPLKEKDSINITRSSKLISFVELEKNYFFKSLQEKFAFK